MKKVLFVSRVSLFPAEHGGAKSIRSIVASMTAEGVQCRTLVKMHPPAPARIRFAGQRIEDVAHLNADAQDFDTSDSDTVTWTHDGAEYVGAAIGSDDKAGSNVELARRLAQEIELFRPDAVVVCDDALDDTAPLARVAADSGRLVFLATTIHCLPFGPYSIAPSQAAADAIKRAKRVIAPSAHVAGYIKTHLGLDARVLFTDVFGEGPFLKLGRREGRFITMINPCAWKGGSIFTKLARSRPDLEFAAVPTWGATEAMLAELRSLPNVTILKETPDIDEIFAVTRVLLVPSLCQEAFGLVSPEALLRGVPVVASAIAGLRESTLGAATLVAVTPMPFDRPPVGTGPHDFVWNVPENPIEPWSAAVDSVLATDAAYDKAASAGKTAAEGFIARLREERVREAFV